MFDPKQFEDLAKKLYSSLPTSLQNFEKDIQHKFKEILQAAFARMDLVTREDFDVQIKVLARTRQKVDALEKQIKSLLKEKPVSKKTKKTD
jgi:BMFP domain-containing protein YqiC